MAALSETLNHHGLRPGTHRLSQGCLVGRCVTRSLRRLRDRSTHPTPPPGSLHAPCHDWEPAMRKKVWLVIVACVVSAAVWAQQTERPGCSIDNPIDTPKDPSGLSIK